MGGKVDNQGWQIQLSPRKCDVKSILTKQLQLQNKITQMCLLFDVHSQQYNYPQKRQRRVHIQGEVKVGLQL